MMLEVVEPNQNALTFDINKIQEFTDSIALLINDASLRLKFGHRSRELFEERFQLESVNKSMMVLYTKLMSK
jgi:glycosyltransferase involved in cell wall biosynthesis